MVDIFALLGCYAALIGSWVSQVDIYKKLLRCTKLEMKPLNVLSGLLRFSLVSVFLSWERFRDIRFLMLPVLQMPTGGRC
jgi:hypothetical protein